MTSSDEDPLEEPAPSQYTGLWAFLDTWWAPIWLAVGIITVITIGMLAIDWWQTR